MDERKLINEGSEITTDVGYILWAKYEGRDLADDGPKCLQMLKRLEAIVKELYGVTGGDTSQTHEAD